MLHDFIFHLIYKSYNICILGGHILNDMSLDDWVVISLELGHSVLEQLGTVLSVNNKMFYLFSCKICIHTYRMEFNLCYS